MPDFAMTIRAEQLEYLVRVRKFRHRIWGTSVSHRFCNS
jgi:hypothetical protein